MNQPTPSDIAALSLQIQREHQDWIQSKCLQEAYNLWDNARLCIEDNQANQQKELKERIKKEWQESCQVLNRLNHP